MTLASLIERLERALPGRFLDRDAAHTLAAALAGTHRDPIAGSILAAIASRAGGTAPESNVERAAAVAALSPLRLAYMKDDAPVEGFRLVEGTVRAIDDAFNDQALGR